MIESIGNVNDILTRSQDKLILVYKHSSACPICSHAKAQLEAYLKNRNEVEVLMVTVQERRDISNEIAEKLGVKHETPQLLFVKNGIVEQSLNHYSITKERIEKVLAESLAGA